MATQISGLNTFIDGNTAYASTMNENFTNIQTSFNTHADNTTGEHGVDGDIVGTTDTQTLTNKTLDNPTLTNFGKMVPIGSIIPFYDFSGDLTFNTTYWAYCNGQTKTIVGATRTLPDMSNRYLVGFGTEGGEDIGSASWSTSPVGNDSHQVNLHHRHTHVHTHSNGDYRADIGYESSSTNLVLDSTSDAFTSYRFSSSTGSSAANGNAVDVFGTSSGANTNYTSYGLSATQSIQPKSIKVRFIMRIA